MAWDWQSRNGFKECAYTCECRYAEKELRSISAYWDGSRNFSKCCQTQECLSIFKKEIRSIKKSRLNVKSGRKWHEELNVLELDHV